MIAICLAIIMAGAVGSDDKVFELSEVVPRQAMLSGSAGRVQILATGRSSHGILKDLTTSVKYTSADRSIAVVTPDGRIHPVSDGSTTIEVCDAARSERIDVVVSDFANQRPVHFVGEVMPIFSKHGCNAGGCHGKASGQNGFRLSLLGFDPAADFESLTREGRGRRVFPAAPEASLLVKKPTGQLPHGGGRKFAIGSPESETLIRWIGQGMPFRTRNEPELVRLEVEPGGRLIPRQSRQQLRVLAFYRDGSSSDVTRLAQFQSNASELAEVDANGVIQTQGGIGEAAIMARFGGLVAVARATVFNEAQRAIRVLPLSDNLVDSLVSRQLQKLGLDPSAESTDAEFARRSSLDICGQLPRPDKVMAFETDPDPRKRQRWVEQLLAQPEYADYFALKWSSLLKNKRGLGKLSQPGTFAFHGWIRQAMAENKPYDRFVAEIVAARGPANVNPPVYWYRQTSTIEDRADDTAQLFLGLRIQCARCHHHPSERWSQDDYYGFASLFARIGLKAGPDPASPRLYNLPRGLARNPVSGIDRQPKPLGDPEFGNINSMRDPRDDLVAWMRKPNNPYFARALVNRYWKHFLGRGLVEPEDDLRVSNPPTHPELLDALAEDFVQNGYDLKRLVRTIATSQAYDRSSLPNPSNSADRQNFARFFTRRLPAEVLLDAVGLVTGSPENFANVPDGFHAIQLPDDGFPSFFLDLFGRPKRESVCECERSSEPNLGQTLHLLSSDDLNARLTSATGRAARLTADPRPLIDKITELYRLAFSRPPTDEETRECREFLEKRQQAGQTRQGYEDLIWTLINTKEFLFNH